MNNFRIPFLAGLLAVAGAAFGQTTSQRFVPMPFHTPKAMLAAMPLGAKSSTDKLHLTISLPFADPAGVEELANAVSDPKSPTYRQFIGPDEIGRRFGLPLSEIQKVSDYLASQGMTVHAVANHRLTFNVDATVAQAQSAFHISIEKFAVTPVSPSDDGTRFTYTTPPQLPTNIAFDVLSIWGLENFTRPKHHNLTPQQMQSGYTVSKLNKTTTQGLGRTIGISAFAGFSLTDVVSFCNANGLPVPSGGASSNISTWLDPGSENVLDEAETSLDVQAIIGMAPLCNLRVYLSDFGEEGVNPFDVWSQEASENVADTISESWGWGFDNYQNYTAAGHTSHVAMTLEGITYLSSSGDSGTSLAGEDYPDIEPEVLDVGGTFLTVNTDGSHKAETGWNSNGGSGGGGWIVNSDPLNVRPPYQLLSTFEAQPGVPSTTAVPYRLVPDVSYNADPNSGLKIYYGGSTPVYGGTSLATPLFAASLADAEEQLIADGYLAADSNGHFRFGRINDLIYSYNGTSSIIYDVTSGTNGHLPNMTTSNAGPGWDFDSGWGSVIWTGFVAKIENVYQISALSASPNPIAGGSGSTGTITISPAAKTGGVTVNLTSSSSDAQMPATVSIPSGATTATFAITSNGVNSAESITITATVGSNSKTTTLTLNPATVSSVVVAPTTVVGGSQTSVTGTVYLTGKAGASGDTVTLSSSNAAVVVLASASVGSNGSSATFTVTTSAVTSTQTATITASFNGSSQTTTLTVTPFTISGVTMNPTSVLGGSPSTGTVTISPAPGTAGATVNLASSTTDAKVPTTITVPSGATTSTFTVTTNGVAATETATLTASYGSSSKTAPLTIQPAQLSTVALSPTILVGGNTSTGTVTLNGPAATGGTVVTLSSNSPSATVPSSVTVAAGATTATFSVSTGGVSSTISTTITGTLNGTSQTAKLTIQAAGIKGVSLSPTTVVGGSQTTVTGTVTLTGAAGASGDVVTLLSTNTAAATVPASITVAAGSSTGTFIVTHLMVATSATSTIEATFNGNTETTGIKVTPFTLSTVTISPTTVTGGGSTTGTVTLNAIPGGSGPVNVNLSSNTAAATVSTTVAVPVGSATSTFPINTTGVASTTTAVISGTINGTTQTASLKILSSVLQSISVSPTSVVGGSKNTVTGTVTLSGIAPSGGQVVTLSSSNTSAATVPASVTVAAGATSATFTVNHLMVSSSQSTTFTATSNGNTETAGIKVNPFTVSSVVISPTTVNAGSSTTGTVTLNAVPGSGPVNVTLSSNLPAATVPTTTPVAVGSSSGTFTVNTTGVTSTTIAVISGTVNSTTQTGSLKILASVLQSISVTPTSVVGGSQATVTGTVTLSGIAPTGGQAVTIASSNTSAATVPSSVTVAAGSTSATFAVTPLAVTFSQTATFTASSGGNTETAGIKVNPLTVSTFTLSPTTVLSGASSTGTVTLNAVPVGAVTVSLASSSAAATVPATMTVPAGSATGQVTVQTTGVSANTSATVTATLNSTNAKANITVQPAGIKGVSVSASSVVGGSQTTITGTVTLTGLAPAGGDVVTLSSTNTSAATVPASVTVPAGSSSATFTVSHQVVTAQQSATFDASFNGNTETSGIKVLPFALVSVGLSPTSVTGGASSTGTVTLNAIPGTTSGPLTVGLTSSSLAATVPSSVTVAVGSQTGQFTVNTTAVTANTSSTIAGTFSGNTETSGLTIKAPALVSVGISPTSVVGSSTSVVTGTITLTGIAPAGGITVTLTDSNTTATSVPATVTVPAGQSTITFTVGHVQVTSQVTAVIQGSLNGVIESGTLTVMPG